VAFGEYGLQSLDLSWITGKQIEAARVAASHYLHRSGKVYIRIFPSKSISKKPLETRMGKGKAEVEQWVAVVKPGMVMFEMGGIGEDVAKKAMARIAHKMPIKCRFITRRHAV
jgi:large subunit ribosomal protein L16